MYAVQQMVGLRRSSVHCGYSAEVRHTAVVSIKFKHSYIPNDNVSFAKLNKV